MKKFIAIVIVAMLSACTNADNATKVLSNAGYTNIQITGYNFFACSKDDTVHTGFTATAQNGNKVEGTVCGGLLFKNSTIRFD